MSDPTTPPPAPKPFPSKRQRANREKLRRGELIATLPRREGGELRLTVVANKKGPAVTLRSWGKGDDGEMFPWGFGVSVLPFELRQVSQVLAALADRMEGEAPGA